MTPTFPESTPHESRIAALTAHYTPLFVKNRRYVTRPCIVNGHRYETACKAAAAIGVSENTIRAWCNGERPGRIDARWSAA